MKKLITLFAFLASIAFAAVPASYAGDHGHDSKSADTKSSDSKSNDSKSSDSKSNDHDKH